MDNRKISTSEFLDKIRESGLIGSYDQETASQGTVHIPLGVNVDVLYERYREQFQEGYTLMQKAKHLLESEASKDELEKMAIRYLPMMFRDYQIAAENIPEVKLAVENPQLFDPRLTETFDDPNTYPGLGAMRDFQIRMKPYSPTLSELCVKIRELRDVK